MIEAKGLTLVWHGGRSSETKLLDREGRNLLEGLFVQSLEFKAGPEDGELVLRIDVSKIEVSGAHLQIEKRNLSDTELIVSST